MIVRIGDTILCPRYPDVESVPLQWLELEGRYEMVAQTPSVYSEDNNLGVVEIGIDDKLLLMSDGRVLLPVNETMIRIVGGIFDGEIMEYEKSSGELIWQGIIFRPIE